jgi:hypothetical protein
VLRCCTNFLLLVGALVLERDRDALVQERQLAQPRGQRAVVVDELREDEVVGLEPHLRAGLLPGDVAEHAELRLRVAAHEVHVVLVTAALDPHFQALGERVHDGHTHAVQTAGDLVAVLVELAAGVQHRHGHLDARELLHGVDVHGDAAAVVLDGDGVVGVNDHAHAVGITGQRFVDGVVHHFVHEVVQPALRCGADVHAGALADRLQPLEHRDLARAVLARRRLVRRLGHEFHSQMSLKMPTEYTPKGGAHPRRGKLTRTEYLCNRRGCP